MSNEQGRETHMTSQDMSAEFYRNHASQYATVAHEFRQSVYVRSSHPSLRNDWDALEHLTRLAPGKHGLDAGCGAGARDVFHLWSQGYDVVGIDAIEENIQVAHDLHPEVADRVFMADLRQELPFADEAFDFVMCNAVIQHIDPEIVQTLVLPELARVIRPQGVLQLMFKNGEGSLSVYDKDYGVERSFQLYDETRLLEILLQQGMTLVPAESPGGLGGLLYFADGEKVDHCLFFTRKVAGSAASLHHREVGDR